MMMLGLVAQIAFSLVVGLAAANSHGDGGVYAETTMTEFLGEVRLVCDLSGEYPLMYLELNQTLADNPPLTLPPDGYGFYIDVPDECEPYQHSYVAYNPQGHPPVDGKGGGYGLPHYDIHFYTISNEERMARVSNCTISVLNQCDETATDAHTMAFFEYPPAEYTTGFFVDFGFGNHAVVHHGMHLFAESERAVATCDGPNGVFWLQCLQQFQSLLAGAFVDLNCTCGTWEDEVGPLIITHRGEVIAHEIMPTVRMGAWLADGTLPNPYLDPYPAQEKYNIEMHPPINTWSYLTADGYYQHGLQLASEEVKACPLSCEDGRRRKLRFGYHDEDACQYC